jgi:hypothetical protein
MKERIKRPMSGKSMATTANNYEKLGGTMKNLNRLTIATNASGRTSLGSTMPNGLKTPNIGSRRFSTKSGKATPMSQNHI